MDITEIKEVLHEHGQEHLIRLWDDLNNQEKLALKNDLADIDFVEMSRIFKDSVSHEGDSSSKSIDNMMEPICQDILASVSSSSDEDLDKFYNISLDAICKDEVGVLLLAGGQGTRLGVPYPKGMYNIGLPSGKSLYEIQCQRILRLEKLAALKNETRGKIMMYIMTSEHTKKPTEDFFQSNGYFGLQSGQIVFFEQRMIPCFDLNGKIILESRSKVARSPDGNGGLYWALKNENVLANMIERGVKYLHVFCVDNVLVKVADPLFMGYCIGKGAEAGNKVVEKIFPSENLGVVCYVGGKLEVVEYSEIGKVNAEARRSDGKLKFNAGNICNHFFTTNFLKEICENYDKMLTYHVAKKKIPYFDEAQRMTVTPKANNGIKLEKFVFDVFRFSKNFVIWECKREQEFSPLKNADGALEDTPTSARKALFSLHRSYIEKSGGMLRDSKLDYVCEISPLLSYAGEGLENIAKGKEFISPLILTEDQITEK